MATYTIRNIPVGLVGRARARARTTGARLEDVMIQLMESYADGHGTAVQMGRAGGRARAQKLTAAERSAIARQGADARWGTPDDAPAPVETGVDKL